MNQNKMPLLDAVERLIDTNPAYFRIPGHRMERGISSRWAEKTGSRIFAYDVTETPFTDDLHAPEGAIRKAQELMSGLYGADESFFLVNGTTCGNEAMIMSAAFEGDEIMVARNAHKSAMMGLILSGAKPVYVMPDIIEDWGIQGAVKPESVSKLFKEHPNCGALFLVSPTYYGICSDLKKIADICHENNALLLVDEAHGGHLYFDNPIDSKCGALECGADVCVQSLHKVAGALTQASVLHVKNNGIRSDALLRIRENLHLVQSTSPSYLLMISLDCARYELAMRGGEMYKKAKELAEYARAKINKIEGFECMEREDADKTRLIISARVLGISGFMLDELLFEKYGVNMELSDHENTLAIVTYANEKEELERLICACEDIAEKHKKTYAKDNKNVYGMCVKGTYVIDEKRISVPPLSKQCFLPREAYFSKKQKIKWNDAVGKVSGQIIAPYPPGIPAVYPGELISREVWEYVEYFRQNGRHIHGADRNGKLEYVEIIE